MHFKQKIMKKRQEIDHKLHVWHTISQNWLKITFLGHKFQVEIINKFLKSLPKKLWRGFVWKKLIYDSGLIIYFLNKNNDDSNPKLLVFEFWGLFS